VRALFHLPYPGYLRLYGSTVSELAKRGNEVLLAYDSEKQRSPAAEEVEQGPGVTIVDPIPRRKGSLADLVSRLRIGADYMRYLDPRFERSPWLRERMERYLPDDIAFLTEAEGLDKAQAETLMEYLRALEGSIPTDPAIDERLKAIAPDCIVVSPVLARGRSGVHQRDSVKSARALGIPVAVAVASWDHLTSKGVIGELPDALYVWNNAQKAEALKLHGVPKERIVVTGAQLFDQWFEREPTVRREEFLGSLGLDPARVCLLYVGSSPNITPVEREREAVREWIGDLRRAGPTELSGASVLVRPHPGNVAGWADVDFSDLGQVAISPRERPDIVMSDEEELHYFHSLHFSGAVVGINTSAMIEAAIVGRAVHTIPTHAFDDTREGTLHFHMLTPKEGGCLRIATDLDEHFAQLEEAITEPAAVQAELSAFVHSFVRPNGLDRPSTRVLAKAIERLPRTAPA
jgi:hypothetical protein